MTTESTDHASRYRFFGACVLLFLACAAQTTASLGLSSAMGRLPMCDGSMTAMTWLRIPGQTWLGAAASFLCMWVVMMAAMMLPAVSPWLWRYRQVVRTVAAGEGSGNVTVVDGDAIAAGTGSAAWTGARLNRLAALAACGYFAVWAALGAVIYPLGAMLAAIQMRQPVFAHAAPFMVAGIVIVAGGLQFTAWKNRHLACCRQASIDHRLAAQTNSAWRHGVHLGWHCIHACAGLTAVLLAMGHMNPGPMIGVTIAILAERLARNGQRVARVTGAVLVLTGLVMAAEAGLH